jgi:hypothetical protein
MEVNLGKEVLSAQGNWSRAAKIAIVYFFFRNLYLVANKLLIPFFSVAIIAREAIFSNASLVWLIAIVFISIVFVVALTNYWFGYAPINCC